MWPSGLGRWTSDWHCSVLMVWVRIPSTENKQLLGQNSRVNFQIKIYTQTYYRWVFLMWHYIDVTGVTLQNPRHAYYYYCWYVKKHFSSHLMIRLRCGMALRNPFSQNYIFRGVYFYLKIKYACRGFCNVTPVTSI
jgi:hypothetical protein